MRTDCVKHSHTPDVILIAHLCAQRGGDEALRLARRGAVPNRDRLRLWCRDWMIQVQTEQWMRILKFKCRLVARRIPKWFCLWRRLRDQLSPRLAL